MNVRFVDSPARQQFGRIFDILPGTEVKDSARHLMSMYREETSAEFQAGFIEGLGCALQLLDAYKASGQIEQYSELEQNLLTMLGAASRMPATNG